MDVCETCREVLGNADCNTCPFGNPCLGCTDYDEETDTCISNGGCAIPNPTDNREVNKI